jgi:hippurate hydrolase
MPHHTIDPIPVACELVGALQALVTRRIDAFDPVVLTVTQVHAGTTHNVIPETAQVVGTTRAVSERARTKVREGIERVAAGVCAAHGAEAKVFSLPGYPVTENDAGFAAFVRTVAHSMVGDERTIDMPAPIMGAEDFSYILQRVPGAMAFLGVRPEGDGPAFPIHSNRMLLNEDAMAIGSAMQAAVALRWLETGV